MNCLPCGCRRNKTFTLRNTHAARFFGGSYSQVSGVCRHSFKTSTAFVFSFTALPFSGFNWLDKLLAIITQPIFQVINKNDTEGGERLLISDLVSSFLAEPCPPGWNAFSPLPCSLLTDWADGIKSYIQIGPGGAAPARMGINPPEQGSSQCSHPSPSSSQPIS